MAAHNQKSYIGLIFSIILLFFIIYFAVMNTNNAIYTANDLDGDGVKLFKSVIPPDKIKRWRE